MPEDPEVLVVGAGPAGVVAALLLGDLGVRTLLVDKRVEVSSLPRARGIHARATEILRQLAIEADMVASALPVDPRMEIRTTLAAEPVAVVSTGGSEWTQVSPCDGIAIAQDVFEAVLRKHLARRASVQLRLGVQLSDLTVTAEDRVHAVLSDRSGATVTVAPAYVIGADGWRSDTRRLVGIEMDGESDLGSSRSVRFRADLSPWLGSPPPAFVRLLTGQAVLLATHPDNRWVVIRPGAGQDADSAADLVRSALGVDAGIEVLGDTTWIAAVQVAHRFRRGPVFLIGDAAHRVTPVGATGISSAMADAHNLTWKLAAALHGWAGPALLDTYAAERSEVARQICDSNRQLWQDAQADRPPNVDLRLLDMGYVYDSEIVLRTATDAATSWSTATMNVATPHSAYAPTATPGARAPHAWIHSDGRRVSTIDRYGRGFVLVTDLSGAPWVHAASHVAIHVGIPVTTLTLDEPDAVAAYGLSPGQVVLVRPDGHIAWRSTVAVQPVELDQRSRQLEHVLAAATGHRDSLPA
jgi:putative polyketide hydroxylase